MSANVDSSQILRFQKKMVNLDFGRLVMLNEGLGGGSISSPRRDSILDVKVCSEKVLLLRKRGKSHVFLNSIGGNWWKLIKILIALFKKKKKVERCM